MVATEISPTVGESNIAMNDILVWMLDELRSGWLEVAKLPSKFGGYTRVVVSQNAPWYQTLCESYTRTRRKRYRRAFTIIKRCHTIRALERMIAGDLSGVYAERILDIARGLTRGEGEPKDHDGIGVGELQASGVEW